MQCNNTQTAATQPIKPHQAVRCSQFKSTPQLTSVFRTCGYRCSKKERAMQLPNNNVKRGLKQECKPANSHSIRHLQYCFTPQLYACGTHTMSQYVCICITAAGTGCKCSLQAHIAWTLMLSRCILHPVCAATAYIHICSWHWPQMSHRSAHRTHAAAK